MSRKVDWLKLTVDYFNKTKSFERHLKKVKPLSISNGEYKAEFVVSEEDLNKKGNLHEGVIATMVDVLSSHALLSHGNGYSGMSSNIHITHYQPAILGDVLSIDAKIYRVNDPMAFVEIQLSKKNGEGIIARGQHAMFIRPFKHEKSDEQGSEPKSYKDSINDSKK